MMVFFNNAKHLLPLLLTASFAPIGLFCAAVYMGTPVDPMLGSTFFLISFSIYSINKYTDKEDIINRAKCYLFYKSHGYLLHLSFFFLLVSMLLLHLTHKLTLFHWIIILLGIGYSIKSIPFVQNKKFVWLRLKDICFAKSLCVAFTWGSSFFAINWFVYPDFISRKVHVVALICNFFLATFINTVFCDIRDIEGDRATGVPTIPARFGIRNTYRYAVFFPSVIFAAISVLLALFNAISYPLALFFVFNLSFPILYIVAYHSKKCPPAVIGPLADSCCVFFSLGLIVLHLGGY